FLGLTLGCAKCHDHKFDPIEQTDFFRLQACFSAIVPRDDAPPVTPEVLAVYQEQFKKWEQATEHIRSQIEWVTLPCKQDAFDNVLPTYDPETREAWLTPEGQRTTRQRQLVALSSRHMNSSINKRINKLDDALTVRVIVNGLCQQHFGTGMVATSNDCGSMGDDPSHAQLLDWLACELVDRGWSLKAIHRLMVLAATYQQSSQSDPGSPVHQE